MIPCQCPLMLNKSASESCLTFWCFCLTLKIHWFLSHIHEKRKLLKGLTTILWLEFYATKPKRSATFSLVLESFYVYIHMCAIVYVRVHICVCICVYDAHVLLAFSKRNGENCIHVISQWNLTITFWNIVPLILYWKHDKGLI